MKSNQNVSFFRSRFFAGAVGFVVGIFALLFWQAIWTNFGARHLPVQFQQTDQSATENSAQSDLPFPDEKDWDPFLDDFMNQSLLEPGEDPFSKLEQMREKMLKRTHPFDSWYQRKFGGGAPGEVKKREDEQSIFYEISIKGLDPESLNVKVENGQILLQGKVEVKDENGSLLSSSFYRSFPTPVGVISQKVEIENKEDRLILKFPKIKAE